MDLFNTAGSSSSFLTDMLCSVISTISKPGKYTSAASNYRSISLFNTDFKLLAKVIANKFMVFLPEFALIKLVSFQEDKPQMQQEGGSISFIKLHTSKRVLCSYP